MVFRGVTPGAMGFLFTMHFRSSPYCPYFIRGQHWPSNADAPRQTAELVAIDPARCPRLQNYDCLDRLGSDLRSTMEIEPQRLARCFLDRPVRRPQPQQYR
jgi:hypothetical protein